MPRLPVMQARQHQLSPAAGTEQPAAWCAVRRITAPIWAEVRSDLPLYGVIAAYVVAVRLMSVHAGRDDLFQPSMYAAIWLQLLFSTALIVGIPALAIAGIRRNRLRPLIGVRCVLMDLPAARLVAAIGLFSAITLFYGAFTSAKNLLPLLASVSWDAWLADLDDALHLGAQPWRLLADHARPFTRLIDAFYSAFWGVLLTGTIFVFAASRGRRERRRFFLVFFLIWIVLGNLVAGLLLSGGPIFYDRFTGDAERFRGLVEHLSSFIAPPLAVHHLQAMLWQAHASGRSGLGTGISAFPSVHLAIATLAALALGTKFRLLAIPGMVVVLLTLIGSVHLGWHYAIDGYASILFVIVAWWLAGRLTGRAPAQGA